MNPATRRTFAPVAITLGIGTMAARVGATPPASGPFPSCSVPCVSIGDATMLEGDSGTRAMIFPVTLSRHPAPRP